MSNEVKVGLLAIIALIVFYVGFSYLKGKDVFSSQQKFYVKFDHVQGLVASSPIYFRGLSVGIVEDLRIMPNDPTKILATLIVDNNVPVNNKTVAKIYSTGLISDKAIDILLNEHKFARGVVPSSMIAQEGDTLGAEIELDLTETVALEVRPVRDKADKMLGSIDSILSVIKGVFDQKTQNNITSSIESIEKSLTNFEETTSNLNIIIESERSRFDLILSNIESITTDLAKTNREVNLMLSQNTNRIANIMENADKLVDNVEVITANIAEVPIKETINNLQTTVNDLDLILRKVNEGDGSMALLLNDSNLYQSLNSTASSLDVLLNDLKNNPKKYVQFSLIERKQKKQKEVIMH